MMPGHFPSVGYLLTTCNDVDNAKEMWPSFKESIPAGSIWAFVAIDGLSTDGSVEWWQQQGIAITHSELMPPESLKDFLGGRLPSDLRHLSIALNVGIKQLKERNCQYVAWLHTDMKFPQEGWAEKLVEKFATVEAVGKASPIWSMHEDVFKNDPEGNHNGNTCPWIIPVGVFDAVAEKRLELHGSECKSCSRAETCPRWFCEKFVKIGGREDWDMNKVIMELGLRCVIFHDAVVEHEGEGTRGKRDTSAEQRHNAGLYYQRWGQDNPFV